MLASPWAAAAEMLSCSGLGACTKLMGCVMSLHRNLKLTLHQPVLLTAVGMGDQQLRPLQRMQHAQCHQVQQSS